MRPSNAANRPKYPGTRHSCGENRSAMKHAIIRISGSDPYIRRREKPSISATFSSAFKCFIAFSLRTRLMINAANIVTTPAMNNGGAVIAQIIRVCAALFDHLEMAHQTEHFVTLADGVVAESAHAFEAEAFDIEAREDAAIDDRLAQPIEGEVAAVLRSEPAGEATGERVARAGRIVDVFERIRGAGAQTAL